MNNNKVSIYHLETVGKILANASYFYYNLEYLVFDTNEEEKKVFNSYPVLKKIRLTLWSLIVLDLHKLLSKSSNDKFRISKLVNCLIELHKKINWENEIDIKELHKIKSNLSSTQTKIEKIKEIRDTQIAHFDDINLNYKLELDEIFELITLCQDSFNTINYALNNSTSDWRFSDAVNFKPVVKNLYKYSMLKQLFYKNLKDMNEKIELAEMDRIIKASR